MRQSYPSGDLPKRIHTCLLLNLILLFTGLSVFQDLHFGSEREVFRVVEMAFVTGSAGGGGSRRTLCLEL